MNAALRDVRRDDASARAVAEAEALCSGSAHAVGVVVRPVDEGCTVVVVRGELGTRAAARLHELAEHDCARADVELVLDLDGVRGCHADATAALARLRAEALARGSRVTRRPEGDERS